MPRLVALFENVGNINHMQHFGAAQTQGAPAGGAGKRARRQNALRLRALPVQFDAPAVLEILARRDGPGRVEHTVQQFRAVRAADPAR